MTETVLKFLYENRQSLKYNKINHLLADKRPIDVRYFIRDLVKNNFVSMSSSGYDMLGNGNPTIGLDTVELKAKIKPHGEQHYLDTYVKKNDTHQINAQQVIYAGGDINAPTSQANDHSDSNASQSIAIDKKKRETAIQIIKNVVLIISAIASVIAIYEFFIK